MTNPILDDQETMDRLESLIDYNTVADVLEAVATICRLKAEHIRENWQDSGKAWDRAATKVESCSASVGRVEGI